MTANAFPRRLVAAGALLLALAVADRSRAGDEEAVPGPEVSAPAAVPAAASGEAEKTDHFKLYWKDGKTVFETDDFLLTLSNRVQFRFTQLQPDDAVQLPGTQSPGDGIGTFRIRRAKTKAEGWFWKKELEYELQLGWAGSDSTGGSSIFSGLEDAYLNWDASKNRTFRIKGGQFKVPFGRQELNSSESLQFVDRSILSGEFTHSRDVGIAVGGRSTNGKIDYWAGIFNGNGRNKPINDNDKYQYDARLMIQPWGDVKYSEGDFESKDKPLLAIAADFEQNDLRGSSAAPPGGPSLVNLKNTIFGGDVAFKYKGFSAYGEYFSRKREPETGPSFHSDGFQVQAGYFLKRDKWEVAFRYAWWDPSDARSGDDQKEIGGALNYFILKHDLKVQADFREIKDKFAGARDKEFRVQTQFAF